MEEDGIRYNEFNRTSHFSASDGRLFFGGLDGVTIFHPDALEGPFKESETPLVITDYQQFDNEGQHHKINTIRLLKENTIILKPSDRFFRLEFALLTYEDVDKNQYAYQIEGVDEDWNIQKENFLRFSRLPFGKHILRIKGQSKSGQWSQDQLAIKLSVLKPFYLQTWFLISGVLLLVLSVFGIIKGRIALLKRQKLTLEREVARQTEEIFQQAEELKSLEKLKSRFFANVSHELRTPLSLMLGPLDSLRKRELGSPKNKLLIEFVHKHSRQLLKLVNEILDLSKLETNRLEVNTTAVHFYEFLKPLTAQFGSFGDNERVKLAFDYRADPDLKIWLDENKFEKIIHNFLANAIKFTPFNGSVDFIVEEKERDLLVIVKDTGVGIHPNDLPHIFDRFYQSKQPDAPVQGGTGIGLSLCKELAELLNGKVWAESKLGKGSTFYFQFPKVEAIEKDIAISHEEALTSIPGEFASTFAEPQDVESDKLITSVPNQTPAPQQQPEKNASTILIVEDNTDLRTYVATLLEEDYQIITAENGKDAWNQLSGELLAQPPNLIISDLMMPVMDGFQLLEAIKNHDRLRHLPVIMRTARADIRVKLNALRIGVDDYIVKPFIEEELKVRIKNLLENLEGRLKAHSSKVEQTALTINAEEKPVLGEADLEWLEEVEKLFDKIIQDTQLNQDWVAKQLYMSRRQFYRRIKQLTGLTPNAYLREMRLQTARDYLYKGTYTSVKEVSYAVGFSDIKYFSKLFKERFGILPSEQML